ncbi:MAG: hypothetical protein JNN17_17605 [Verrucomicrobiaceae bacterium]|nr:hypothetical protein [Verrucomicrobiaceae bacterium]
MKIRLDHKYHGAAIIQIAEDDRFTAINSIKSNGSNHRSAFRVNDDIGVYLKYAEKPSETFEEFQFTFNQQHLDDLAKLKKVTPKLFICLVCVKAEEICCIKYDLLLQMIVERRSAKGEGEDTYAVLVNAPKGKGMRTYMNKPGRKGVTLTKHIVSRSAFPSDLFA